MAANRVIGMDNNMPWHLPADLKHFKAVTIGKPVIMGRKTYESIGKALPGRTNIVITSNKNYPLSDAKVAVSCDEAIKLAAVDSEEIMIIGGGKIYETLLPKSERLYLTFIDLAVQGDTFFPDYLAMANWRVVESQKHNKDENNPFDYEFVILDKVV